MDNDVYYSFSASLRVMDAPEIHEEISSKLKSSHEHKKGEVRELKLNKRWENSVWILKSPLPKTDSLTKHLEWIWETIKPHIEYFKSLIDANINIDIFCSYTSDCDNGGFELKPQVYEMLATLKVQIGFSIIVV